jgi:hypothetical protein
MSSRASQFLKGGEQCRLQKRWHLNEDIRFLDSRTHQFVPTRTRSAGIADRLELRTMGPHLLRSRLKKMASIMLGIVR